ADLLQRRAAVHALPQKLLLLREEEVILGAAVLEDVGGGAAEAGGQARQLAPVAGDPLGPALEVGERARDLACLEAGAILAADEQLDPRPLGPVLGLVARIPGPAHRPLGHSEGGSAPLPNLPPETGCAGGAGARSETPIGRGISRGHVAFTPTNR